jgi:hypothetical protein
MIHVRYGNSMVAAATGNVVAYPAQITILEADHPLRRWAVCMGYFAQQVASGAFSGSYDHERARLFARQALLPDKDFCPIGDLPDAWLAECFNVPLSEIEEKRRDLRSLALF